MSMLTPQDVYGPELMDVIDRRLGERPVLLVGPIGSGSRAVALALARGGAFRVILDPGLVGDDYPGLVSAAVRQIARQVIFQASTLSGLPPLPLAQLEDDTPAADNVRLRLANHFGPDVPDVIAMIRGERVDGWYLERALATGSLPRGSRVIVLEAHRLRPEPAIWELRQIANEAPFQILLTTRPAHVADLTGPRSAVFGNASMVELRRPPTPRWAEVLAKHRKPLLPGDLEWLLQRTRGRPRTTIEVLAHPQEAISIQAAWSSVVSANGVRAENIIRLAEALHPYAPGLLEAVALGKPPYGAIEGAPSQRIARTLARLRDLDLIEQPEPRHWEVADPLLGAALIRRRRMAMLGDFVDDV